MIRSKLETKNCNSGQLFLPGWVSLARFSIKTESNRLEDQLSAKCTSVLNGFRLNSNVNVCGLVSITIGPQAGCFIPTWFRVFWDKFLHLVLFFFYAKSLLGIDRQKTKKL